MLPLTCSFIHLARPFFLLTRLLSASCTLAAWQSRAFPQPLVFLVSYTQSGQAVSGSILVSILFRTTILSCELILPSALTSTAPGTVCRVIRSRISRGEK